MELLASGRDADVYAVDDHRVLRRHRDGGLVDAEVAVMRHVARFGNPRVVARVDVSADRPTAYRRDVPSVAACLLDVYETILTCDFAAHEQQLPVLAGLSPDVWNDAFHELAPDVTVGRLSMAAAYAEVLSRCDIEPVPDLVDALVRRDRELLAEQARVYDDVVPFLKRVRARGIKTAFVSNCAENTRPLLDDLGLDDLVDAVVLSCEVGCAKPSPDIYRSALETLGVPLESAILVDDQPAYCAGAAALGIAAVQIVRNGCAPSHATSVSSLAEVEVLLS